MNKALFNLVTIIFFGLFFFNYSCTSNSKNNDDFPKESKDIIINIDSIYKSTHGNEDAVLINGQWSGFSELEESFLSLYKSNPRLEYPSSQIIININTTLSSQQSLYLNTAIENSRIKLVNHISKQTLKNKKWNANSNQEEYLDSICSIKIISN